MCLGAKLWLCRLFDELLVQSGGSFLHRQTDLSAVWRPIIPNSS